MSLRVQGGTWHGQRPVKRERNGPSRSDRLLHLKALGEPLALLHAVVPRGATHLGLADATAGAPRLGDFETGLVTPAFVSAVVPTSARGVHRLPMDAHGIVVALEPVADGLVWVVGRAICVYALGLGVVFAPVVANLLVIDHLADFQHVHALAHVHVLTPLLPLQRLEAILMAVLVGPYCLQVEDLDGTVELWNNVEMAVPLHIVLLPMLLSAIQSVLRFSIARVWLEVLA
mmetsp:Transcript_69468/g.192252  ORF Transcript_69468/g.192252 Transcript_69468/m.192252 type:complete len:231 (-) Transcript_69468:750-1442(-)